MHVCIVGGGVTGALAALYLQKHCAEWTVTMLENPNIKPLPVGENLHRHTFSFVCDVVDQPWHVTAHELMDLNCAIKLSGQFNGWSDKNLSWDTAFTQNSNEDVMKMHNAWLATRGNKPVTDYFDSVYGDVMCHIKNNTIPENYLDRTPDLCCMYIDATKASGYLKSKFKGRMIQCNVVGIERNHEHMQSVILEDNTKIAADFFFDCTGFARVVIEEFAKFQPIHTAMVNSAYAGPSKHLTERVPVFSNSMAMNHGWMFKLPMQHRTGVGYVFNNAITDLDTIKHEHELYGGESAGDRVLLKWDSVSTDTPWSYNVLALGIASFWNEPFLGTSLELSTRSIINFVKHFKESGLEKCVDYNRWFVTQTDLINTRLLCMYHYCKKDHTDFWKHVHEKSHKTDIHEKFVHLVNGGFTELLKSYPNLMWSQRDWEILGMLLDVDGIDLARTVDAETLVWAQNKWNENRNTKLCVSSNDFYTKWKEKT